jgi:hypothetical protein
MDITSSVARRISQFAWVMAAAGTVIGQVHALARAQAHPEDFEESPLARAWGEPAIRVLRPLREELGPRVPCFHRGGLPGLPTAPP